MLYPKYGQEAESEASSKEKIYWACNFRMSSTAPIKFPWEYVRDINFINGQNL